MAERFNQSLLETRCGTQCKSLSDCNVQHKKLETVREKSLSKSAVTIQKMYRMWALRKYYLSLRKGTIKAQACTKRWIARRLFLKFSEAALVLESFSRMIKAKKVARKLRLAVKLQAGNI
jgi:hypothetical protein